MNLLRSSIIGQEFINYRKASDTNERKRFSYKIRSIGLGFIPIIIDSIDKDISTKLANTLIYNRPEFCELTSQRDFYKLYTLYYTQYGRPMVYHMDDNITCILSDIQTLFKSIPEYKNYNFNIGLEDGTFPSIQSDIGTIYKLHRNEHDKILYLLLTKEQTMYEYIMSIIKYIKNSLKNSLSTQLFKKI